MPQPQPTTHPGIWGSAARLLRPLVGTRTLLAVSVESSGQVWFWKDLRLAGTSPSEKNDAGRQGVGKVQNEAVRFIQMWVLPDEAAIKSGYEQLETDDELLCGGLVTIASGIHKHIDGSAIRINNRCAVASKEQRHA